LLICLKELLLKGLDVLLDLFEHPTNLEVIIRQIVDEDCLITYSSSCCAWHSWLLIVLLFILTNLVIFILAILLLILVVVLIIFSFLSRLVATTLDSLLGDAFGGRSLSNHMHMLDFRTLLFELL
jgi:hypothetical protein